MKKGRIFPIVNVNLLEGAVFEPQCKFSYHFLMISMKTLDRETQTTNETFAEHVVPNMHVATCHHARSQWNIMDMALFEQNRLWLHLPGLKGQSLRSRGEVKNLGQQDDFAYLLGYWGVPFLTDNTLV